MRKKKKNNKALRTVLLLALVVVVIYVGLHSMQNGQTDTLPQSAPTAAAETASSLTLLTEAPQAPAPAATEAPTQSAAPEAADDALPTEDGSYTEVEDVAYYLHTYGHLPDNYMTKSEAEDAGWVSTEGNLWDVAYGASIGGDRFGNYEGQLPKGEKYYEADVNYDGGYRGGERIIYTEDGDVWYTSDHYESFERLY